MGKITRNYRALGLLILGLILIGLGLIQAQLVHAGIEQKENEDRESGYDWQVLTGQHRQELTERLKKLRDEDPERFRMIIKRQQSARWLRLRELTEKALDKFREIMQRFEEKVKQRLESLEEQAPQRHKEIINRFRRLIQLHQLRRKNPEEFRLYLKEDPQMRSYIRKLRGLNDRPEETDESQSTVKPTGLIKGYPLR